MVYTSNNTSANNTSINISPANANEYNCGTTSENLKLLESNGIIKNLKPNNGSYFCEYDKKYSIAKVETAQVSLFDLPEDKWYIYADDYISLVEKSLHCNNFPNPLYILPTKEAIIIWQIEKVSKTYRLIQGKELFLLTLKDAALISKKTGKIVNIEAYRKQKEIMNKN